MKKKYLPGLVLFVLACAVPPIDATERASEANGAVIDIGSRLELFVDDFLIDRLTGGAEQRLHHPVPQEIIMVHDSPWEGSCSGYHTIFRDGDIYRMYYKACGFCLREDEELYAHPLYFCYAESEDGIHWSKPELGLYEFQGSRANNIVMITHKIGDITIDAGHGAVFKDDNPEASPDARYKAFFRATRPHAPPGLIPFKSPDGIHWSPMIETRVLTSGTFDSQNLAFWDSLRGEYRVYWRYLNKEDSPDPNIKGPIFFRSIRTARSKDFLRWRYVLNLDYGEESPLVHLYTNVVKPYYRAPHLYIGFPVRYIERGWSPSMRALPELEHRELRARLSTRYGTALTESLIMFSRDGVNFKRWEEAFLRPGIERPGTWNYGQQYIAWHLVETRSPLNGAPNELSLYATESYWTEPGSALRRYTLRLDGFVSIHAPMSGGEMITRPLTFSGSELVLNFSTSAAGDIRVEIQDESGHPLPGFTLDDCPAIFGDSIERAVVWKNGRNLADLQGNSVRLRFVLRDADLFSLRFK